VQTESSTPVDADDGRSTIERPGFSYLPRFITAEEATALIDYFGQIRPLWEQRHRDVDHGREGEHSRRLTRPVYWLGAWQFACLGYYAEPDHREDRCLRAEPFPDAMTSVLDRLRPTLHEHDESIDAVPNSCLINYYGREISDGRPRDYARLRMHRDGEPGPVVMFSIGQPGLLEFLDPAISESPELAVWTRHRSVSVLSGPDFKDRLYHRITQVRYGDEPTIESRLENFQTRRVSVSFRHVPEELILDFDGLSPRARDRVQGYVEDLAEDSAHFREQLGRRG
jgi:alkylated DNA repair protein (DNA oxidative demethylase)